MFQEFHTDTLASRFVKSLLAQTPLPIFDAVVEKDHLISGRYYVYRKFIIRCVSSGVLLLSTEEIEQLTPSDNLYPSVFLYAGTGYKTATFKVVGYADAYNPKTHSVFNSSTNDYDSRTHYHLGRYLRYLHTTTGLNLMPFYNCYNSTYFRDIDLYTDDHKTVLITNKHNPNVSVVGIPIQFGKTYTIAVDCPNQVLMRACIYEDNGYLDVETTIKNSLTEVLASDIDNLKQTLASSGKIYSNLKFKSPVTYRLETSSELGFMLEKNLYLVIQLPVANNSSIVVLENYDNICGVKCNTNSVRKSSFKNLSLLKMNTKVSYAFSDRLVEYLLGNVIAPTEDVAKNVAMVQTSLANIFPEYANMFITRNYIKGVWDSDISRLVISLIERQPNKQMIYDQDGNINKDIEALLYSNRKV